MRRGSAPTMKDVAREAGVALGTVSKVFNNGSVGEDYRSVYWRRLSGLAIR